MAKAIPINRWAALDIYYHLQHNEKSNFLFIIRARNCLGLNVLSHTWRSHKYSMWNKGLQQPEKIIKVNEPLKVQCSIEEKQLYKCGFLSNLPHSFICRWLGVVRIKPYLFVGFLLFGILLLYRCLFMPTLLINCNFKNTMNLGFLSKAATARQRGRS